LSTTTAARPRARSRSAASATKPRPARAPPSAADANTTFNTAADNGVTISTKNLTIVGNTGTVVTFDTTTGGGRDTLTVSNGRTVTLIGVSISQKRNRSSIVVNNTGTTLVLRGCTVGPSAQFGVQAATGTNVTLDRTLVQGNATGGVDLNGQSFSIENSVFLDNGGGGSNVGGARLAFSGSASFRFNTVTRNTTTNTVAAGVICSNPLPLSSSIVFSNTSAAGQVSAGCTTTSSLLSNPSFAADRFHVDDTSPALDASTTACPALDVDGEARPMDGGCDVGADERPVNF
jgi:hypothetical protein